MVTKLDRLLEGLQSYAIWIREAQDDTTPRHKHISIDDMDADLLKEAAATIVTLHKECARWRTAHNEATSYLTKPHKEDRLIQPGDE